VGGISEIPLLPGGISEIPLLPLRGLSVSSMYVCIYVCMYENLIKAFVGKSENVPPNAYYAQIPVNWKYSGE
jgi:hypothetical protein